MCPLSHSLSLGLIVSNSFFPICCIRKPVYTHKIQHDTSINFKYIEVWEQSEKKIQQPKRPHISYYQRLKDRRHLHYSVCIRNDQKSNVERKSVCSVHTKHVLHFVTKAKEKWLFAMDDDKKTSLPKEIDIEKISSWFVFFLSIFSSFTHSLSDSLSITSQWIVILCTLWGFFWWKNLFILPQ